MPPVTTARSLGTNELLIDPSELGMLINVGYAIIMAKTPANSRTNISFHGCFKKDLLTLYKYAPNIKTSLSLAFGYLEEQSLEALVI